MDRFSTQPKYRIYIKGYGFLSFLKNTVKTSVVSMVKSLLIVLKNPQQMNS